MKRRLFSLALATLLMASVLCGCGSSSSSGETAAAQTDTAGVTTGEAYGGDIGTGVSAQSKTSSETKRIYTAGMEMETTSFDEAAQGLSQLTERSGGYFESSSIDNYGAGYRTGTYTVRVPAKQFTAFCQQVGKLCHVISQTTAAQDVSEVYYDTAGRLKTQQTKLERLQALLAKAEKMEDIITIESAISETEQQIDSLSGELQHYDALVDYSTVNLTLNEVYKLSNVEEPVTGFGGRVAEALSSGWKNFVNALEGALVVLAYGWMWVLLLAAVVIIVCRVRNRKRGLPAWGKKHVAAPEKKEDRPQ